MRRFLFVLFGRPVNLVEFFARSLLAGYALRRFWQCDSKFSKNS